MESFIIFIILLIIWLIIKNNKNSNSKSIKNTKKQDKNIISLKGFNCYCDDCNVLFDRLEIKGINYRLENVKKCFKDTKIRLVFKREPDNPYDKNAIKIMCKRLDGKSYDEYYHIGYVDREHARIIVENNLLEYIYPRMNFISMGENKVFITDYSVMIRKDKLKELKKQYGVTNIPSLRTMLYLS